MSAVRVYRTHGAGRFVILCDHASNFVPAELHGLGLPESELSRHIAWDIGAAEVARILADGFESPAILARFRVW